MKNILSFATLILLASCSIDPKLINAYITPVVQTQDFTDPLYVNFQANKILLISPVPQFDQRFVEQSYTYSTTVKLPNSIFYPTRQYSNSDRKKVIEEQGFDSVLIVSIGADNKETEVTGYSSGFTSNYAANSNQVHTTGHTNAVTHTSRNTTVNAKLYDAKTENIIWVGTFNLRGSNYSSSDTTIIEAVAKNILLTLNKQHHISLLPHVDSK